VYSVYAEEGIIIFVFYSLHAWQVQAVPASREPGLKILFQGGRADLVEKSSSHVIKHCDIVSSVDFKCTEYPKWNIKIN